MANTSGRSPLRTVFMGTSAFALPTLRRVAEGTELVGVVTQPDRPAGRGRKPTPPPVKVEAERLGLPVYQPERVRAKAFLRTLQELSPEVIVIAAYGQLLPRALLELPPYGCLNVHPSLLPRYRGAAPIQWALWNGDEETGVTIMQVDEGEDSGPILLQRRVKIGPDETAAKLHDRLAELGAEMMLEVLRRLKSDPLPPVPQNDAEATRAPRLTREMGLVDWRLPARALYNRFRACVPWPGTYTFTPDGKRLRILACRPLEGEKTEGEAPGTVRADRDRLRVATGEGILEVLRSSQRTGRRFPFGIT
ncbi:MAG: methionyl-tRNA formyltransferase [Candidatus Poribacteria bacterium]|nr:MAG: methionyl-tRNA formyltransferase [Candidatus Poribacteria bacterium]